MDSIDTVALVGEGTARIEGSRDSLPAVSVIIPTFNRCEVLRFAIQSVCAQMFIDWELIVVGDGCTDQSESVVREEANRHGEKNSIRLVSLKQNSGGQAAPNNAGLAEARAPLVAFLGHDDLWFPWHLEELVKVCSESGSKRFTHGLSALLGPNGLRSMYGQPGPGRTYGDIGILPSSGLFPRAALVELGGFDETFQSGSDVDLIRRALSSGTKIAVSQRVSMLKFPSHWFDMPYTNRGPEPQQTYWRNVVGNAELVEQELLQQILLERIQHDLGLPSLREGVVFASGSLKHDLGRRLQSVPVGRSILEKRTALSRAKLRKVRGL